MKINNFFLKYITAHLLSLSKPSSFPSSPQVLNSGGIPKSTSCMLISITGFSSWEAKSATAGMSDVCAHVHWKRNRMKATSVLVETRPRGTAVENTEGLCRFRKNKPEMNLRAQAHQRVLSQKMA